MLGQARISRYGVAGLWCVVPSLSTNRLDQSSHNPLSGNDCYQGMRAVVSGHQKTTGLDLAWCDVPVIFEFDVGLLKRAAVDIESAVAEGDLFAREPHDTFDHQLLPSPNDDDVEGLPRVCMKLPSPEDGAHQTPDRRLLGGSRHERNECKRREGRETEVV